MPPTPLDLDRFVQRLAGLVDPDRLSRCREEHARRVARGESIAFADLLLESGCLTREQLAALAAVPEATIVSPDALPDRAPARTPSGQLGKYVLEEEIGRGGMGTVYRAYDPGLRRTVALKVLHSSAPSLMRSSPGPGAPDEDLRRFLREAQTAAALRHPNIVEVFESGEADGFHYLAMEFVTGGSLRDASPPPPEFARMLVEVCRGVAHAHAHGIVHRDLKPDNLLLKTELRAGRPVTVPVVADFGLARALDATTQLTRTGQVMGTPAFMSPEQCDGAHAADARSDVYSLGAILYRGLTGRKPFEETDWIALIHAVTTRDPVPPRALVPSLSAELEAVVLKAMDKDPARRYAHAGELADDLERALDGRPVRARPASTAMRLYRRARRHRGGLLVGAIALALSTVLLAGLALEERRVAAEVATLVGEGEALRAAGQVRPARDAFARARALAPGNPAAEEGFRWADGALRVIEDREAQERRAAQGAATAAQTALDKAGRVQNVVARWLALAGTVRELERIFHHAAWSWDEKRARAAEPWAAVEAFIRATPDDPTSQSAMRAFAGWARRLCGRPKEGLALLQESARLDPDLPYGPMMEALVHLARTLSLQKLPTIEMGYAGLRFGPMPAETSEMAELRALIDARLAQADRAAVWGEGFAEDFRRAVQAVQAYQSGRLEEAERGFGAVIGAAALQMFRTEITLARARARYLLKRFPEGVADAERVTEARPADDDAWDLLALLRYGEGYEAYSGGKDPGRSFEFAIEACDTLVRLAPKKKRGYTQRALTRFSLADVLLRNGKDPRAVLDLAAADFGEVLLIEPRSVWARVHRALSLMTRARADAAAGADPRECLRAALLDFDAAEAIAPDDPRIHSNRAVAWRRMADAESARGIDPIPSLEKAIAATTRALTFEPDRPESLSNRGNAYRVLGKRRAESGADPGDAWRAALADLDAALHLDPRHVSARHNRGLVREEQGDFQKAGGGDPLPAWSRAEADYAAALQTATRDSAALKSRAELRYKRAEHLAERGGDPCPSYAGSIEDLDQLVDAGGGNADLLNRRGLAWRGLAVAQRKQRVDPKNAFEQAEADFRTAIARNEATAWIPWANLGGQFELQKRWPEALEAFENALRLRPDHPEVLKGLERARAKAAEDH